MIRRFEMDLIKEIKEADYNQIPEAFKGTEPKEIIDHIKTVITTGYFCFDGRTGAKDFWRYILPVIVLCIIPVIGQLFALATLLPTLGITSRRLHDVGKSGWFLLLALLPVIGGLIVLFFCIPDGSKENNQYGPANEK